MQWYVEGENGVAIHVYTLNAHLFGDRYEFTHDGLELYVGSHMVSLISQESHVFDVSKVKGVSE